MRRDTVLQFMAFNQKIHIGHGQISILSEKHSKMTHNLPRKTSKIQENRDYRSFLLFYSENTTLCILNFKFHQCHSHSAKSRTYIVVTVWQKQNL